MAKAQNYLLMPLHGRFLHSRRILCLIRFYVSWQRSLAALNIKTIRKVKPHMNSQERREARYQRRKAKRKQRKIERSLQVGAVEDALSFSELYKAGKRCCNGVRWKQSTQNFELHLFSKTAVSTRKLKEEKWKPGKYTHFTLNERGKSRPIDAPQIQDRQVHKAYTKNVLLPLYLPDMIWNNGASLEGKGFDFSKQMLKNDLRHYFRRYGNDGHVILLGFKQYFPSAPHSTILERHRRLIFDERLRKIGDSIVVSNGLPNGMPLGVEPSQAEMIALPSFLDNQIKCQFGLKYAGHYMDDYYILVPPHIDAEGVLSRVITMAERRGLTVNRSKTKIQPMSKPFKYCKAKYRLTETGKVIVTCNRDSVKRARRKIKAFKAKINSGLMTYEGLWTSINGILAYFQKYNDHARVLKLRQLFYKTYGFSPEKIDNFRTANLEKGY